MSGSAKKRREKARHKDRRARRSVERFNNACETFERFYPGGVAAFDQLMIDDEVDAVAISAGLEITQSVAAVQRVWDRGSLRYIDVVES